MNYKPGPHLYLGCCVYVTVCWLKVDTQHLAQQLSRLAAKRGCKNRACIYRLLGRSVSAVLLSHVKYCL